MTDEKALVEVERKEIQKLQTWTADQVDLIKRTVAKGTTDDEFKLFLYTAHRMGLDPLAKQIHAVKRWDSMERREVMAIQVGIDGFRLVADRTGKYAPGKLTEYKYHEKKIDSATAYVKKHVDGEWFEVGETAYFSEYVGLKKDGNPNQFWSKMPHVMIGKCAEARALRRAFPAELSGVYTPEELDQVGEVVNGGDKRQQKKQNGRWTTPLWIALNEAGVPDPKGLWKILIKQAGVNIKTEQDEMKATPAQREKLKAMVDEEIAAHQECSKEANPVQDDGPPPISDDDVPF